VDCAYRIEDGAVARIPLQEAIEYRGAGFVWIHLEGSDDIDRETLQRDPEVPDVAANALVAQETRPRCDRIRNGAIVNLRGLAVKSEEDDDPLVSIRLWMCANKVHSRSRRRLAATDEVMQQMGAGLILDPGDLISAFAVAISARLDPEVAALGDDLDDCETGFEEGQVYRLRPSIARIRSEAISYRRFVAPDRDALTAIAAQDFAWLSDDDRLHIREAADRFARMTEELEAVRERAALIHEQISDMRAEQIDQRSLVIAVVAFIFLPLTFITGLLGMNVEGIPFAHSPEAFWGVVALCVLLAVVVMAWFVRQKWLNR